jgi:hypothetical protein
LIFNPVGRAPGTIGAIPVLRHDAFQTELARIARRFGRMVVNVFVLV